MSMQSLFPLRAHPDLSQGPADLQSAALTTELCTLNYHSRVVYIQKTNTPHANTFRKTLRGQRDATHQLSVQCTSVDRRLRQRQPRFKSCLFGLQWQCLLSLAAERSLRKRKVVGPIPTGGLHDTSKPFCCLLKFPSPSPNNKFARGME